MSLIRILLGDASTQLRDAVSSAIAGQPDLVVTAEAHGEVDLLLRAAHADVVVMGWDGADRAMAVAERLFDEYPVIGILTIDVVNNKTLMYRQVPKAVSAGPVTAASLLAAIRRAAANNSSVASPLIDPNSRVIDPNSRATHERERS